MTWTEEELNQRLKENPDLKVQRENPLPRLATLLPKEHKYHAKRTEYNGRHYASKKEAQHAQNNDTKIQAGLLDFYLTQVPFALPGNITHRIDFVEFSKVANTCLFEVHFVEVKGYKTRLGEIKRKQVEELYGIEVEVV